uniref:NSG2 protein n=1 Tax=Parastrongyloides trichosuri TaxID=131310 RepID=A0A0N4ZKT9_PARTI
MSGSTSVPKVEPLVKTESIYSLFDSKTWDKKMIQLNIIILLGVLSYVFCFFYVLIVKMSNNHIYKYKPELVYEIRTASTDEDTYKSIFSPEGRLAYYTRSRKRSSSRNVDKRDTPNTNEDYKHGSEYRKKTKTPPLNTSEES